MSSSDVDFDAAVKYVRDLPKEPAPGQTALNDDQKLLFYSHFKQATIGPCSEHGGSQPWAIKFEV
jgi:acyl-CoA-binding protein